VSYRRRSFWIERNRCGESDYRQCPLPTSSVQAKEPIADWGNGRELIFFSVLAEFVSSRYIWIR